MGEWLQKLLRGLIPPPPGDPKKDQRWRLNVAASLWALLPLAAIFVAMYLNRMPLLPNLVRTDDWQRMDAELSETKKELARNSKNDLRTRLEFIQTSLENLCSLEREATLPALKQAYLERIDSLMERYQHLAGYPFGFPACNNLR